MQKAFLLVQDVETRWNLTYLMLKRLEKLKTYVQNYVANNKFSPENFFYSWYNGNLLASFMNCLNFFT